MLTRATSRRPSPFGLKSWVAWKRVTIGGGVGNANGSRKIPSAIDEQGEHGGRDDAAAHAVPAVPRRGGAQSDRPEPQADVEAEAPERRAREAAISAAPHRPEAVEAADLGARSRPPGRKKMPRRDTGTRPADAAWPSRSVQVCHSSMGARFRRMPGTPCSASQRRAPGRLRRLGVEITSRPVGRELRAQGREAARAGPRGARGRRSARSGRTAPRAARRRCPPCAVRRSAAPISASRRLACSTDSGDRSTPMPRNPRPASCSSRNPVPQPTSSTRGGRPSHEAVDGLQVERHAALEVPVAALHGHEAVGEVVVVGLDAVEAVLAHGAHPAGGP